MQALKHFFRRFVFALIAGGALFGYKMYNKSESQSHMRADLIKMCEKEKPCISAVNKHFDSCFDGAYSAGTKRKGASFNQNTFLSCFNQRAGTTYFSVAEQAH